MSAVTILSEGSKNQSFSVTSEKARRTNAWIFAAFAPVWTTRTS